MSLELMACLLQRSKSVSFHMALDIQKLFVCKANAVYSK